MILDSYESPTRGLSYAVPFVSKFGVFYDKYENFRVRGQSSPHRAKQRLSAGRARDHPVMEIVPNRGGGRLTRGVGDRDRDLAAGSLVNFYFW